MKTCKWCKKDFKNIKGVIFSNHVRWCEQNPNKTTKEKFVNCIICGNLINTKLRRKTCSELCYEKAKHHSPETRKKISNKRRNYLNKNKNKHNWSVYKNIETKPEELFRLELEKCNLSFFQYYIPVELKKNYELDFAYPELKIAFEINGNQHYDKDGNLKEYYLKRHEYFVSNGWSLFEIPYSLCFNKNELRKIINECLYGNIHFYETKINDVLNFRKKRNDDKEKQKEEALKALEKKKQKLIKKRLELIQEIDFMSYGWVAKASKILCLSHTQTKRWIKIYYPELDFYERATVSERPSKP